MKVFALPALLIGRALSSLEYRLNRLKSYYLLSKFLAVDERSVLEWPVKVYGAQYITLGKNVRISWNSWLYAVDKYGNQRFSPEIIIENSAYLGNSSHIVACRKVKIGANTIIGDRCYLSDNLHDYEDVNIPIKDGKLKVPGELVIGKDSWLGDNVCIFGDLTVGEHCVIGANSVVTRSIPSYSVAVGSPARVIKRYDFQRQEWLKTDKFGNFDPEDIEVAVKRKG
jgi:acetyltransferase-like isoleucine patch superfamily enzyme